MKIESVSFSILALAVFFAAGCGCDEKTQGDGQDDVMDDEGGDAEAVGEPEDDDLGEEDGEGPDAADVAQEDAGPDAADTIDGTDAVEDEPAGDIAGDDGEGPGCVPVVPEDEVDPDLKKFALQMLHFNVQYVAGGLEGFCPVFCDYDERATEDLIIRESFVPVLDFYLAHPDWKVDIELQAYMVEIMAERFPDDLEKLRVLTHRGQVSLISFHYSAQIYLAFPTYDQEMSWQMTASVFEENCLPLSTVVFNQEGQFGEGRHAFMSDHGYEIGVFPKNLFKYVRGEDTVIWPYYTLRGTDVVVGPGGVDPESGITVAWAFFDDGEKLAVAADLDPYFGDLFRYSPARMDEYGAQLQALEDEGYKVTTIKDYVNHLKGQGIEQPEMGAVLDGTWQPGSTDGIHRWMGGMGVTPWSGNERDNDVRTANIRTGINLRAADVLLDYTEDTLGVDYSAYRGSMRDAWRHLLLAEVSDASGINPWVGEINYSLGHSNEADLIAGYVVTELKAGLETNYVAVDIMAGDVEELEFPPLPEAPPEVDPPMTIETEASNRTIETTWYDTSFGGEETRYQVVVSFSAVSGLTGRSLRVSFPRTFDRVVYSPGLLENELVDYGFDEFIFQEGKHYVPLPNGIIGLGDDWYVIKHTGSVHVAALFTDGGSAIDFMDSTQPADQAATWAFEVFQGTAGDALALANRINIHPFVIR
ncbi:MAG: hypothetical protein ABIJ56_01755 [Pseudomonadota bacterium]